MSTNTSERFILSFYVPAPHTDACKAAIFKTGAGSWADGLYTETCFVQSGTGQFRPNAGAVPNIGTVGEIEKVQENKVEIICMGREIVKNAVKALQETHPYEVVAYYVTKIEDF